jgi:hypothetical protein
MWDCRFAPRSRQQSRPSRKRGARQWPAIIWKIFPPPCYDGARRDTAHENANLEFSEPLGKAGLSLYAALPRRPKLPWRSHPHSVSFSTGEMSDNGLSGRAPAPPAIEAGKERQGQGACHVCVTQNYDRRNGIDIGKNSYRIVGLDDRGAIALRQKWRSQVEARLANEKKTADHLDCGIVVTLMRGGGSEATLEAFPTPLRSTNTSFIPSAFAGLRGIPLIGTFPVAAEPARRANAANPPCRAARARPRTMRERLKCSTRASPTVIHWNPNALT